MNSYRKITGLALATSAAAIFAMSGCTTTGGSGAAETQTASAEGHCSGVNACKGHGACKTASNACAGQNACKGTGFVALDEKTCADVGGEFEG